MIDNIKTDNVPLLDELIYHIKHLALTCVLKDEETANKYETVDTIRNADIYKACIDGSIKFELIQYDENILKKALLPESIIPQCIADRNRIPVELRKNVIKLASDQYINNYVELNNYYRMLNGLPNLGQSGLKINKDDYYVDEVIGIDFNKNLHEMSVAEADLLFSLGITTKIIENYPQLKYLQYLGSKKIPIYTARNANNFQLIYVSDDTPIEIVSRFKNKIENIRQYTLKVLYSEAFKIGSDYYDNFMRMLIVFQTMIDMIIELPDYIIKRDIFDLRTIELIFQSNGVEFFHDIPLKYQVAMLKNLNRLIKFKSTTKCIVDICSLFGFENIEVFKYYLIKDRKLDENGKYIFHYTDTVDPITGDIIKVPNEIEDFDLKFLKVPIQDKADNHLNDKTKQIDYDDIVQVDKYWNGDKPHDVLKREILQQEFNYIQSKYLSIDTVYDLTRVSFEVTYFYNMLFDNYDVEQQLFLRVPFINGSSTFRFIDVICYLFALGYEYNGIEDSIMDTQSKVMYVKGFNFKADIEALAAYMREKGFTLEELGVSGFEIPKSSVLSYKQLLSIFTKNKNIHDHVVNQLIYANDKKMYDIYKKIYDSLMITQLTNDLFKMSDGTQASTYTEFLSERSSILYFSLAEIKAMTDMKLKKQKISDIIHNTVYTIESYLESDNFKFLFSYLPTVSAESVRFYVYKVINFFKSYKVDIMSINIIYKFDKLDNRINIMDEVIINHVLTKSEALKMLSKLKSTKSTITKQERDLIIERLTIEVSRWVNKFYSGRMPYKDLIKNTIIKMTKNDIYKLDEETIKLVDLLKGDAIVNMSRMNTNIQSIQNDDLNIKDYLYLLAERIIDIFLDDDRYNLIEKRNTTVSISLNDNSNISDTVNIYAMSI